LAAPPVAPLVLGHYFVQGMGAGRTAYRDIAARTGEEPTLWKELALGIGFGVGEMMWERLGLKYVGRAGRRFVDAGEAAAARLGQQSLLQAARRNPEFARRLADLGVATAASAAGEGYEESMNALTQEALQSLFDPERGPWDEPFAEFLMRSLQDAAYAGLQGA